jgi:hypothetical protein
LSGQGQRHSSEGESQAAAETFLTQVGRGGTIAQSLRARHEEAQPEQCPLSGFIFRA